MKKLGTSVRRKKSKLSQSDAEKHVWRLFDQYLLTEDEAKVAIKIELQKLPPAQLSKLALKHAIAWEATCEFILILIKNGEFLFDEYFDFLSIALQSPNKKPSGKHGSRFKNTYRDHCLQMCVHLLKRLGYLPITRSHPNDFSACDIVAKIYGQLTKTSISHEGVRSVWRKVGKKETEIMDMKLNLTENGTISQTQKKNLDSFLLRAYIPEITLQGK